MKSKIIAEIYKNQIDKKSDRANHTEYFLVNGKMMDGGKKKLKDVFESQKKIYGTIGIKNKIKDLLFGVGIIINKNPEKRHIIKNTRK